MSFALYERPESDCNSSKLLHVDLFNELYRELVDRLNSRDYRVSTVANQQFNHCVWSGQFANTLLADYYNHRERYGFRRHVVDARVCLRLGKDKLNDRERDFLDSIQYLNSLSSKQADWLDGIARKLKLDWRRSQ